MYSTVSMSELYRMAVRPSGGIHLRALVEFAHEETRLLKWALVVTRKAPFPHTYRALFHEILQIQSRHVAFVGRSVPLLAVLDLAEMQLDSLEHVDIEIGSHCHFSASADTYLIKNRWCSKEDVGDVVNRLYEH